MTKRVAIYLRVSTDQQTTYNQKLELEAVAKRVCAPDATNDCRE